MPRGGERDEMKEREGKGTKIEKGQKRGRDEIHSLEMIMIDDGDEIEQGGG